MYLILFILNKNINQDIVFLQNIYNGKKMHFIM